LDIWPLYLFHPGAVTVNFAVQVYATCTVRERNDGRVRLRSTDLAVDEFLSDVHAAKLPLPAHLVRFFSPMKGVDVVTNSQAPAGAGLAGSSTLMVAVAGALRRLTGYQSGKEKLREIVQNVEALVIGVPTGCQDYYPALYGGVNAIELGPAGVKRVPIAVDAAELDARIVLAYTGAPRQSGINNWQVMKAHIDGDRRVHRNFDQIAAIARAMRAALEKADWAEAGRLMREEWAHRRKNAPGISTALIDRLVKVARNAGAAGAKVCGAGGGGCVAFLVERGAKPRVEAALRAKGASLISARLARRGLRVEAVPE
jgi:D-glycero-alpha-D-manno-heptose-7-phosphate kinase